MAAFGNKKSHSLRAGIELYFPKKIFEEAHRLKIPEDYVIKKAIPLYDQLKRLQENGVLAGNY